MFIFLRLSLSQVFLFDKALVVTRPVTRGEDTTYQVSLHPFYTISMRVERVAQASHEGSFRGVRRTVSNSAAIQSSSSFRVSRTRSSIVLFGKELESITFTAKNEHDCKAWLDAISSTAEKALAELEALRSIQREELLDRDRDREKAAGEPNPVSRSRRRPLSPYSKPPPLRRRRSSLPTPGKPLRPCLIRAASDMSPSASLQEAQVMAIENCEELSTDV